MKKIAIIIPCWMRSEILSLTIRQLNVFVRNTSDKVDITVIYAFSHNDPELKQVLRMLDLCAHPHIITFCDNNYLGQKINDAIQVAVALDYDYIMNLGSDDLIHPKLIDLYLPFIEMEIPVFGVVSVYFYQRGQKAFNFQNYNGTHLIGAGRMIHKNVVKKVVDKFGGLYSPEINRGMDTHSGNKIKKCGIDQIEISTGDEPLIVDVKSEVNIHSYDAIRATDNELVNIVYSDIDLFEYFPVLQTYEQN